MPEKIENVTVICKANVYFDGRVVSHTVIAPGGQKKSVGLIFPGGGPYRFNTDVPERMEITAGACRVRQADARDWREYAQGDTFHVPGGSSFEIDVERGIAEYVCTFE